MIVIDWTTVVVILAILLVGVSVIVAIASFVIRQYIRLMKMLVNLAIAVTIIVTITLVVIAAFVFYVR